jgi:hypothetical protein
MVVMGRRTSEPFLAAKPTFITMGMCVMVHNNTASVPISTSGEVTNPIKMKRRRQNQDGNFLVGVRLSRKMDLSFLMFT